MLKKFYFLTDSFCTSKITSKEQKLIILGLSWKDHLKIFQDIHMICIRRDGVMVYLEGLLC